MSFVRKDKATLRDHLKIAAASSINAQLQLIPPELSNLALDMVGLFFDVAANRGSTGFGPAPVSYRQILDWEELRRVELEQWQINMILKADRAYLSTYHELAAKDGN